MAVEDLKADLRTYLATAEDHLPPIDVQLRAKAVISELANPSGLQEHEDPFESGLEDILRSHADVGALGESIAAEAILAEQAQPESPTSDTPSWTPPPPAPPVLNTISPTTGQINDPAQLTLTANGSAFKDGDVIVWDGATDLGTTYVSESQLTSEVPSGLTEARGYPVHVRSGELTSGSATYTATDPTPPEFR
jgi:hypothetical protein